MTAIDAASGTVAARGISVTAIRVVTIATVLVAWEILALSGLFYRDIVPSVPRVLMALIELATSAELYKHMIVTLYEVALGFFVAVVVGVACGILFGIRLFLGAVVAPYVDALATTPKIVFLPIIMLIFGVGPESKTAIGALSGFFPVVLSTAAGVRQIKPVFIDVARSFNVTVWQSVRKVYLPALSWPIVTGMRLGLGVTVIGVLLGEIKMSSVGLGFLARDFYDQFRIPDLYALLIVIFGLAVAANAVMSAVGRRFDYAD
jgi:NitT/TauT family transport system permease protein